MVSAIVTVSLLCFTSTLCANGGPLTSADAFIRQENQTWVLGSSSGQRTIAVKDGRLLLTSLENKLTGAQWTPAGAISDELPITTEGDAADQAAQPWTFVKADTATLAQGELRLELTMKRGPLTACKTYVVYPGSSIVREWVKITNTGGEPVRVTDPSLLNLRVASGDPANMSLHWMTGGENSPGSWLLKTESLPASGPRAFDSYDPFSAAREQLHGDGVNAKILLNDRQVWPADGWQYVPSASTTVPFDLPLEVQRGDRVTFLANMNANIGWDTTAFDPTIRYANGTVHTASKEFSGEQGRNGWGYGYVKDGKLVELIYYPEHKQWRNRPDNATGTPFVAAGAQHPDVDQDAARVWTAPESGKVRITGSVCNTGNAPPGAYGFKMGSGSYAPWYALYSRETKNGLFIGWDYFGHWASSFQLDKDKTLAAQLRVAGHKQTLAPGQSLTTPAAFVGLFSDDLDNAGNECLDWQYRYLWDYTRDEWFPAIRMLGYWFKGTGWGKEGVGWTGGKPDWASTFRKVFRVADLMRYVGADVYHRDWGWWDRAGDWNGPDFRATGEYLRKSGMRQLIYAFLYTVDGESKVAREHPDWVINGTLDMSLPAVVEFMKGQLDGFVERWGDFEWRNDSVPTAPRGADDTPLLGQDQGLREVIRAFLDKYPRCAFQAVNGGGNDGGYDYVRYASTLSFSDGAVGILRNYYAALLFPPDKCSDIPDVWDPDKYDPATWRGLLCINFDMTGDTWDPAKLEGLRELIDIYHYLFKQGVVGRWVKVYRPIITGDDPTMYFERLSADRKRGIVIIKRPAPGPINIKPKGLLPDETYLISFHESQATEKRTGRELMDHGIAIEKMPPGELVYLNLPLHPGSKADRQPPAPPANPVKRAADNMGYPGVELSWSPGTDDNWVSYYEISRDGKPIDKVAKGMFYFDHSAGADLAAKYAIRTVDGAGNASEPVSTDAGLNRAQVFDDAAGAPLTFTGQWQRQEGLQPAHAGTLSTCSEPGRLNRVDFHRSPRPVVLQAGRGLRAGDGHARRRPSAHGGQLLRR